MKLLTCSERLPQAVLVFFGQGHARPRGPGLQEQGLLEGVRVVPPDVCLLLKRKHLPEATVYHTTARDKPAGVSLLS